MAPRCCPMDKIAAPVILSCVTHQSPKNRLTPEGGGGPQFSS